MIKVGGYKKITSVMLAIMFFTLLPSTSKVFSQTPLDGMTYGSATYNSSHQQAIANDLANVTSQLNEAQSKLEQALKNPKETPEHLQQLQDTVNNLGTKKDELTAQNKQVNTSLASQMIGDPNESYCTINPLKFSAWKCLLWLLSAFLNIVSFSLIAVIMTISGWMFDLSIYFSIVNMGVILSSSGVLFVWSIARDLANMSLIFVLLYSAFNIIIEKAGSSDPKKLIVSVIIVALLVNFSGFLVRAAVDVSNVVAYEFYKAIIPDNTVSNSVVGSVSWGFIANSQAAKFFMGRSESANTTGMETAMENQSKNLSLTKIFGDFIFDLLFGVVAFFVFIYLAILFIIRIVTITAVFMFSPLLVLSHAIPGLKKTTSSWQKTLTNQIIFAPVMMFFLYATMMMMKKGIGFNATDSTGILGGLFGNSLNSSIYYVIVMGILVKSTGWAKGIADTSGNWGSKTAGAAIGLLDAGRGYAVGKFAKSETGKNITNRASNWYNNANSRTARLTRAFGRTAGGKAVGDFTRDPFSTMLKNKNLNFVDRSTEEKWKNFVETGKKEREKQIEDRLFGSDDNKFSDEQVVMNFLGMNAADQEHAYSKMNDKQRGAVEHLLSNGDKAARDKVVDGILSSQKLDSGSISTITDPVKRQEAEQKAAQLKSDTNAKLDGLLGGTTEATQAIADEKVAKAAESALKSAQNAAERAEEEARNNPTDTAKQLAARTARAAVGTAQTAANTARTTATTSASRAPIMSITSNVAKSKTSLSGKEKGEVKKAAESVQKKIENDDNKKTGKKAIEDATPIGNLSLADCAKIRNIDNETIVDLYETNPDQFMASAIVPLLTTRHLKALADVLKGNHVRDVSDIIRQRQVDLSNAGQNDSVLNKSISYIQGNSSIYP